MEVPGISHELQRKCGHPIFFLLKLAASSAVGVHQLLQFFTAMIESIVLYASEAWGAFISWNFGPWDRSLFERINFRSCKAILQVSSATDNIGARSELGKSPLLYSIQKRSIRYWASLSRRPDSIIGKLLGDPAYNEIGIATKVRSDIMINCKMVNTPKAIRTHRAHYETQFSDYWRQRAVNSPKLSHFYYTFKTTYSLEKYLCDVKDPTLRKVLATFRLGNHKLACETLRSVRPRIPYEDRKCSKCEAEAENEIHFLFRCSWVGYRDVRQAFTTVISNIVNNFKLLSADDKSLFLMIQENKEITECLAQYIIDMSSCRQQLR